MLKPTKITEFNCRVIRVTFKLSLFFFNLYYQTALVLSKHASVIRFVQLAENLCFFLTKVHDSLTQSRHKK